MIKHLLIVIFLANYISVLSIEIIKNAYIVRNNNDTVYTKVIYCSIVELQYELVTIDSSNVIKKIFPGDIKEFVINFSDIVFRNGNVSKTEFIYGNSIYLTAKYFRNISFLKVQMPYNEYREKMHFKTTQFSNGKKIFLELGYGDSLGLQLCNFYEASVKNKIFLSNVYNYELVLNNSKIVGRYSKHWRKQLSLLTKNYTLLSEMINRKFYHIENGIISKDFIVQEYNNWLLKSIKFSSDTSEMMKGIFDAQKYYKPKKKLFAGTAVGTSIGILPGIIIGLDFTNKIDKNRFIQPIGCKENSVKYKNGYTLRANYKNKSSVEKGLIFGYITCCLLIGTIVFLNL